VLGAKVGDQFIVDSGLAAGEVVVSRGVFKLDSELQLKARPSMMNRGAGLVETPAAGAEASLLGQWSPVLRALGRLRDAAADGDEQAAGMALDTIASAVNSVSTASFHPVTMSAWGEFSMRLKNAIVIAKRKRGAELPIAFRDVRHAVEEAGRYLGLPSQTPASQSAATEEEIAELKSKLDAYLTLSTALAADDEAAARAAVPALAQQLGDGAQALADAEDIAAIRKAFDKVSQDLIAQVRAKGADRVGSVYVVHCPMVDDYEGADWISAKAEVINPYFGAEMLSCGTLTENLSFDAKSAMSQPGKTDPHAGH
jgi:Cu(I)/Ag(I) efflux system membrane fusion protein